MSAEFESMIARGVTLISFNVAWCAPCRVQEKITGSLARRFSGRAAVSVVDVDQNTRLATRMGINSVPTLVLFRQGREINRFIGLQSEETLAIAIEKTLNFEESELTRIFHEEK